MKTINIYITEKLKINKDSNLQSLANNQITKDFEKLFKIISRELGKDSELLGDIVSMMEFADNDYEIAYYEYNDNAFYYLLRDIVNYDLICLKDNGEIDINNSNHKDIAEILDKYNTPEMGKKVRKSFNW